MTSCSDIASPRSLLICSAFPAPGLDLVRWQGDVPLPLASIERELSSSGHCARGDHKTTPPTSHLTTGSYCTSPSRHLGQNLSKPNSRITTQGEGHHYPLVIVQRTLVVILAAVSTPGLLLKESLVPYYMTLSRGSA